MCYDAAKKDGYCIEHFTQQLPPNLARVYTASIPAVFDIIWGHSLRFDLGEIEFQKRAFAILLAFNGIDSHLPTQNIIIEFVRLMAPKLLQLPSELITKWVRDVWLESICRLSFEDHRWILSLALTKITWSATECDTKQDMMPDTLHKVMNRRSFQLAPWAKAKAILLYAHLVAADRSDTRFDAICKLLRVCSKTTKLPLQLLSKCPHELTLFLDAIEEFPSAVAEMTLWRAQCLLPPRSTKMSVMESEGMKRLWRKYDFAIARPQRDMLREKTKHLCIYSKQRVFESILSELQMTTQKIS